MGVTPRGVDYDDWEDYNRNSTTGRITIVMSRKPVTEENKEERAKTDSEERNAQANELIYTVTKPTEEHQVLCEWKPVHAQLEKGVLLLLLLLLLLRLLLLLLLLLRRPSPNLFSLSLLPPTPSPLAR